MKLLEIKANNFASYDNVELDFSSSSLTLIHGPTGAGKSTLLDLVCWVLFGVTAKNGSVDEVRSWNHVGEPTKVVALVSTSTGQLQVTRIRSSNPTQNDLFWTDDQGTHRGKNLNETQSLLEQALECTSDQYLTGAYFHEFSKTGTFFLAKAKDRRTVFENIADLEFPKTLAETSSLAKTSCKKEIKVTQDQHNRLEARLEQLNSHIKSSEKSHLNWASKNHDELQQLITKSETFEQDKSHDILCAEDRVHEFECIRTSTIEHLTVAIQKMETAPVVHLESCSECGGFKNEEDRTNYENTLIKLNNKRHKLKRITMEVNPHIREYEKLKLLTNQYDSQIQTKQSESNPFVVQMSNLINDLYAVTSALEEYKTLLSLKEDSLIALESIYSLSFELRGQLLKNSISQVAEATNRYLETYFDSELRVVFSLDSDDLNTEIYKNGNSCVYSQLSKGQRGLLKLAFAVSIMDAASNAAGVRFNALFFDEALDGLDNGLKSKAFRLFQDLSTKHDNVFVVDHSEELRSMFDTKIQVSINNDISEIKHE